MANLRLLSSQGDTVWTWDREKAETGDAGALEAIREAERIIRDAQAKGAVAFRIREDQVAERIDAFDPGAREIILVPRIVGG